MAQGRPSIAESLTAQRTKLSLQTIWKQQLSHDWWFRRRSWWWSARVRSQSRSVSRPSRRLHRTAFHIIEPTRSDTIRHKQIQANTSWGELHLTVHDSLPCHFYKAALKSQAALTPVPILDPSGYRRILKKRPGFILTDIHDSVMAKTCLWFHSTVNKENQVLSKTKHKKKTFNRWNANEANLPQGATGTEHPLSITSKCFIRTNTKAFINHRLGWSIVTKADLPVLSIGAGPFDIQ